MRRKDLNLITLAKDLAEIRYTEKNIHGDRFCHSASVICATSKGGIKQLSIGRNHQDGHHAEVDALLHFIRKHPQRHDTAVDLMVVRVDSRGELAMSKPCVSCTEALRRSGVGFRHIYYSVNKSTLAQTRLEYLVVS